MGKNWYILVLLFLLGSFSRSFADSTVVKVDHDSFVRERCFDAQRLQEAKKNPDYVYDIVVKNEAPTFFDKLMYKIGKFLFDIFYNPTGSFQTILFYIICLALVALLVYLIMRMNSIGIFSRSNNKNKTVLGFSELEEDINSIDFDKMIEEAIQSGMFRRAIRLNFLKALKLLSDKNLILWEINKTNRDYFYEFKNNSLREGFKEVTYIYEYVWYGNLDIDAEKFSKLNMNFKEYYKKITAVI